MPMNESNHTPGPWFVGAQNDCNFVINKPPPRGDYDGELKLICKVGETRIDDANARLIAAAPELLEACRAFLEHGFGGPYVVIRKAREAITKATGEDHA